MTAERRSQLISLIAMTPKTKRRLEVAAGVAGILAALLFHYKQRDTYSCQGCFATRHVFQWRLGMWSAPSVPLTSRWEQIGDTRFRDDFLPPGHVHEWAFIQGSPYHFFGTTWGGCAIGSGRPGSPLCQVYEKSEEFRAYIAQKLSDGSLTRGKFVSLMASPLPDEGPSRMQEANALADAFFAQSAAPGVP